MAAPIGPDRAPVRHKICTLVLIAGWVAAFCTVLLWLLAPLRDVLRVLAPVYVGLGAVVVGGTLVLLVLEFAFGGWIAADRAAEDATRRR